MPSVSDFASLAPFTMDELVESANAVLGRRKGVSVQARTVRYYIEKGILEPPVGGPKNARYSARHLEVLVAVREGLDSGLSLAEAARGAGTEKITDPPAHSRPRARHEDRPPAATLVRRIPLLPGAVLEVEESLDLSELGPALAEAIRRVS